MPSFIKDPDASLDYSVDWSEWLATASDSILTSTWTVPDGLTVVTQTNSGTLATVWLSGGTAGKAYSLTNHITTRGNRTDDRTIVIIVRNL